MVPVNEGLLSDFYDSFILQRIDKAAVTEMWVGELQSFVTTQE